MGGGGGVGGAGDGGGAGTGIRGGAPGVGLRRAAAEPVRGRGERVPGGFADGPETGDAGAISAGGGAVRDEAGGRSAARVRSGAAGGGGTAERGVLSGAAGLGRAELRGRDTESDQGRGQAAL